MVDDAVRALQSQIVNEDREEINVELKASAYIPETYISGESIKLQMYKKDEQNKNIGYTVFANIEESHTSGDLLKVLKKITVGSNPFFFK